MRTRLWGCDSASSGGGFPCYLLGSSGLQIALGSPVRDRILTPILKDQIPAHFHPYPEARAGEERPQGLAYRLRLGK